MQLTTTIFDAVFGTEKERLLPTKRRGGLTTSPLVVTQEILAQSLLESAARIGVWLVNDEAKHLALLHVIKTHNSDVIVAEV